MNENTGASPTNAEQKHLTATGDDRPTAPVDGPATEPASPAPGSAQGQPPQADTGPGQPPEADTGPGQPPQADTGPAGHGTTPNESAPSAATGAGAVPSAHGTIPGAATQATSGPASYGTASGASEYGAARGPSPSDPPRGATPDATADGAPRGAPSVPPAYGSPTSATTGYGSAAAVGSGSKNGAYGPWAGSAGPDAGSTSPAGGGAGPYGPPSEAASPPGASGQPSWSGKRLMRSRTDRMVGGVCGGLARYWNTDPVLLRVLTVVLVIFTGGAFLIAYLVALIVIPEEPLDTDAARPGSAGYAAGGTPPYWGPPAAPVAPVAARERSYLGWLVLSVAVLAAGILGLIEFLVPASVQIWGITGGVVLAILGVGLLVGARFGRARWLVVPAIPLAFLTFAAVAAGNWVQQNPNWDRWFDEPGSASRAWGGISVGDRTWAVGPEDVGSGPLDFRLTVGEATLDLTSLTSPLGQGDADPVRVEVDASVGLGTLVVAVPRDMRLELDAELGAGTVDLPGAVRQEGTDMRVVRTVEPPAGTPVSYIIELDAAVGAGNLEVRREAA